MFDPFLLNIKYFIGKRNSLPGPIPLPIIGNLHQIGIRFNKFANEQTKKHGNFWEFYIGNQRNIVISQPRLIQELYKENNNSINYFTKYKDVKLDLDNITINYGAIFNNDHEKWKIYRRVFEKSICSINFLKGLTKSIQNIFNEVELNWNNDIISLDLSVWRFRGLSEKFRRNNKWLFYNLLEIIKQRRKEIDLMRENEPINSTDLLDILLTINTPRDPNGFGFGFDEFDNEKSMTDHEILATILDIDIGGRDPTASTFCFAVYNICKNSGVLQRLREEIFEVLGNDFLRPITFEDLNKFQYLEAIIKETQRIIPLNPLITRQTHVKTALNGHIIEKDTPIWLHQEKLHKDKISCKDGFEFIIERNAALASGTIKNMLSSPGQFMESEQNEVHFRDITAVILEKVCQYLYYKVRYTGSQTEIPQFQIEPNQALELLMTADFLDC
ncbi:17290_t:CDS:2 [Rhizophagus irregularis]|nr:17290_t:CDS:2 [Rhizophagus irregularis]